MRESDRRQLAVMAAVGLPLTALSAYLQYTHCIMPASDGSFWCGQSTYGDLCMHLSFITSLENMSFPPTYNLLAGTALSYPYLTDALSTTFYMLVFSANLRLSRDLCRKLCMRKTGCGEDRKLLSTNQCIQSVDRRYTGLDKLLRITSGCRVHRKSVDISSLFRKDLRAIIDRSAQTVKNTAQHVAGYAKLHASSQKTYLTVGKVDTCGTLKQLHQCIASVDLQNTASSCFAIGKLNLTKLVKCHVFNATYQHQRAGNFLYGPIFFWHFTGPPFPEVPQSLLQAGGLPSHIPLPADPLLYICNGRSAHVPAVLRYH